MGCRFTSRSCGFPGLVDRLGWHILRRDGGSNTPATCYAPEDVRDWFCISGDLSSLMPSSKRHTTSASTTWTMNTLSLQLRLKFLPPSAVCLNQSGRFSYTLQC